MTFNIGHVSGGTNAGWKRQKAEAKSWMCGCPNPDGRTSRYKTNPRYLVACPDCGKRNPER